MIYWCIFAANLITDTQDRTVRGPGGSFKEPFSQTANGLPYEKQDIMNLKHSHAGTLESGDILIEIYPTDNPGIDVSLNSTVEYQFGDQIRDLIRSTAEGLGLTAARINAVDKGALDCTIKARTTAAVVRATGKDVWKD